LIAACYSPDDHTFVDWLDRCDETIETALLQIEKIAISAGNAFTIGISSRRF